jgi:SAM-dependent methyltransferase
MKHSDHAYLYKHRERWHRKSVLRRIYIEQFYGPLLLNRKPGSKTLEIGSGAGFIQDVDPSILRTDILHSPWIHCVIDAHSLPFAEASFDNVIGLDVLHHLNRPIQVLREITRVLVPGGRCVLVEPWITPFSRFIYTYLHQESCDLAAQPWLDHRDQFTPNKPAFEGNAAIPYLLIERGGEILQSMLPCLKLRTVERYTFLTYLLSLGLKRGNLLPLRIYPLLYKLELLTRPVWASVAALRAVIVWEKTA